jgi:hypothetical protein
VPIRQSIAIYRARFRYISAHEADGAFVPVRHSITFYRARFRYISAY